MYAYNSNLGADPKSFQLFVTSRPSRAVEVGEAEELMQARYDREMAWGAQIGMDVQALKDKGFTKTGSPTGTRTPHTFDDYVEDFLP